MELARNVFVFVHLVGFGALFGGALVQLGDDEKVVNSAMLRGALAQVVSGIALVGILEGLSEPVDRLKTAVKFAVALLVAVLCWANRARPRLPGGLFNAVIAMTLVDVGVAVFW